MSKKKWREWELRFGEVVIGRNQNDGILYLYGTKKRSVVLLLSPTEARRLFLALKKDYLD